MDFIADLHIHSHFSMATSKQLRPEYLDYWARIKGIKVVGTGDFSHPGWLKELKEKVEPAEPGLFKLKEEYKLDNIVPETPENSVRFILTAEISNIYKKNGQVRKIHSVLFAPDFETVEKFQQKLSSMNFNITSDGRPILGLDVRDLLGLTLDINENNFFVPAHIWTPWFSVFGSKSGFNSMEECFEDLSKHIHTVETGLSTDPPLNWMCSFLDRYTLVSNSDAHSPEKLGRNANLFKTEPTYDGIIEAMKTGDPEKFGGTLDMFPQEGKYHYDGHRKCGIRWTPVETLKHGGICPVCGKKITVGVTNRIVRLSDREDILERKNRLPYYSIIPLKEILSEIEGVGEKTKKVTKKYDQLIRKAGSEFNMLQYLPVEEVKQIGNDVLAEAIRRMRNNEVIIKEGFDGEYGKIKVFQPDEIKYIGTQESLFDSSSAFTNTGKRKLINFDLSEYRRLEQMEYPVDQAAEDSPHYHTQKEGALKGLNPEQTEAVTHSEGPAAVLAGPGTGKTRVLTRRITHLIQEKNIDPASILAITFTNKAAEEMKERCGELLPENTPASKLNISTFHAFGYNFLKNHPDAIKQDENFTIIDETDKQQLIRDIFSISNKEAKQYASRFTEIKQTPDEQQPSQNDNIFKAFQSYQNKLAQYNLFDLDDLIYQPVHLLEHDPEIREEARKQYQWILVDEFQDINLMQYRLIQLLSAKEKANLFVIGDPNQAIYGFRGSSKRFISRFIGDYKDTKVYKLHTSYRCSKNILQASGDVLQEDELQGLSDGVKIKISPQQTDKSEAEYIARTIESLSGGLRFFSMDSNVTQGDSDEEIESLSDFAILCRTKAQMKVIEKALLNHTIPCQLVAEDEFFSHPLVKKITGILKYSENPDNGYLKDKLTRLDPSLSGISKNIDQIKAQDPLKDKIQYAFDTLLSHSEESNEEEIRRKIMDLAESYGSRTEAFLRFLTLGSSSDAYEHQTEKVTVMTLHASKGLEFKCVFIAGCEDGLIPYSMFKTQETDHEEEKRLLYVGMTRAQSYLYLTHARKRFIMGQERTMQRSPFLNRIEKELTEVEKNTYQKKKQDDSQLKLF
ncbi:MAG: UvrD-helicase domain-containing protein [Bacteroidales bacterium]|nr:UvrD-helicase domain-containing protein [Bacteroidales bacterium]